MASASIIAYFGGDTKGLRAATEESTIIVKGFSRQAATAFREIGQGFIGAVVLMEMVKAGKEAVTQAEKTRDEFDKLGKPLDASTRSIADFGDGMSALKKGSIEVVGFIIGGWTQLIEGITSATLGLAGFNQASESELALSRKVEIQMDATFKAIEAANKKRAEDNSVEKVRAAEEKLGDLQRKNTESFLSGQDKINALLQDENAIIDTMHDKDKGTVAYIQKQSDLEAVRHAINVAGTKMEADEEKELTKAAEDHAKVMESSFAVEKDQRGAILFQKKSQQEAEDAIFKVSEAAKDQAAGDLEIQQQITAALKEQTKAAAPLADAMQQIQNAATEIDKTLSDAFNKMQGIGSPLGGGTDFMTASNATLAQIVSSERAFADAIATGPGSSVSADFAKAQHVSRGAAAQAELDARAAILRDEALGGDAYARRNFKGDPLAFDQFLAQARAGGPLSQDQTLTAINKNLTTINTTLNGVFKK